MTSIRAERSTATGGHEIVEAADLDDLRGVLLRWASGWDWAHTRISSDSHADEFLVGVLPLEVESHEPATSDDADTLAGLYDDLWNELELPAHDDRTLLAAVEVNGRRWALVDQGKSFGRAWLPVPFWDYADQIYWVETHTDGGAYRSTSVYRVAGVTVTMITRDHFDSRTGGYDQMFLEAGATDIDLETVDQDPEGLESPDDALKSIALQASGLDPHQSAALAQHFVAKHGPRTQVQVNHVGGPA